MSDKKVPRCFQCNEIVTFDPARRGKNGRMIPLDPSTNQPHQCKDQEARVSEVEKMYTPESPQELAHPEPAVVEVNKSKPNKVPLTTRSRLTIFADYTDAEELEQHYNEFLDEVESYGGSSIGSTYQIGPDGKYSIAMFYRGPKNVIEYFEEMDKE